MSTRWSLLTLSLLVVVLMTGCGSELTLQVRGVAPLNPTDSDESTPVNARVYQLSSDVKFRNAVVDQLWTKDKETLGDDRIGNFKEVTVLPGAAGDKPVTLDLGELATGTRFIGILALYRRSDAVDKRVLIVPVDGLGDRVLEFTRYSVALVPVHGGK